MAVIAVTVTGHHTSHQSAAKSITTVTAVMAVIAVTVMGHHTSHQSATKSITTVTAVVT